MRLLGFCVIAHIALAGWLTSPWWVPDLTLVGLILAVTASPGRWFRLSVIAGVVTAAWAIRFHAAMFAGVLLVGWSAKMISRHWDATDLRLLSGFVGVASFVMTLEALWLEHLWSFAVLGLAGIHVLLTTFTVPLVRSLLVRGKSL